MDRLNHVKIVTPDPEAVNRFLIEVLDIPKGWPLPGLKRAPSYPPVPAEPVTWEKVLKRRGDDGSGGFIRGRGRDHIRSDARGSEETERVTCGGAIAASTAIRMHAQRRGFGHRSTKAPRACFTPDPC